MKELLLYHDLREEGRKEGRKEEREYGIRALIETCQDIGLDREDALRRVMEKFTLTREEAENYTGMYWNMQ